MSKMQCAIIGATGYTGGELLRILNGHPQAEALQITFGTVSSVGYYNPGESGTARTTGSLYGNENASYYSGTTTYRSSGSTSIAVRDKITKAAVIEYVD